MATPESFLYDVFLSHSSKDKAVVREVAERLREDGVMIERDSSISSFRSMRFSRKADPTRSSNRVYQ
ncbi:MAG: toll/interleukin-1 receptor domain-containing protein [Verrucomicrobiae bacterium]|nr:toll/interleukin-1 receptor domain-containing protein [Verrucomicrobiae bacterium]MCB1093133.1 toll/interleukin-1 receptor domain-containing protein [Verrucomicrobiae bacterium]